MESRRFPHNRDAVIRYLTPRHHRSRVRFPLALPLDGYTCGQFSLMSLSRARCGTEAAERASLPVNTIATIYHRCKRSDDPQGVRAKAKNQRTSLLLLHKMRLGDLL